MSSYVKQGSNSYRRGVREANMSTSEIGIKRVQEDSIPTFDHAWNELKAGKPSRFMIKAGSVTIGAFLMADGIHHILGGYDEHVDDIFVERLSGRNHVRIAAGLTELGAGAAALYMGLTKGPRMAME